MLEANFGLRRLPAVLFFRGPGTPPLLAETASNTKLNLSRLAQQHQWQLVPQLRQDNAEALGCGWGVGVDHARQMRACAVLVPPLLHPCLQTGKECNVVHSLPVALICVLGADW